MKPEIKYFQRFLIDLHLFTPVVSLAIFLMCSILLQEYNYRVNSQQKFYIYGIMAFEGLTLIWFIYTFVSSKCKQYRSRQEIKLVLVGWPFKTILILIYSSLLDVST